MLPLEEQYWGDVTGLLTDPFGVRWSIGQRIVKLRPAERKDRAKAAMDRAIKNSQSSGNVFNADAHSTSSDDAGDL